MTARRLLQTLLLVATTSAVAVASDEPSQTPMTLDPDPETQSEVAARLASGRYRFCTDEKYRLWQADKERLCGRSALAADCAGLDAACQRPAWEDDFEEPEAPGWLSSVSRALGAYGGQMFRLLFWLALGVGALYLVRGLFRLVRTARSEEHSTGPTTTLTETSEVDPTSQPASLLLAQAAAHLDGGDPRRALHFAYAALLAGLDQAGVVRVHRALTSGDYRRTLRRSHPESPAGSLLWDLDLVRFQKAVADSDARHLTERVRDLVSRLATLLLILGASVGCTGLGDQESPGSPSGPRGFALLEELATAKATTFTRRLKRVTELPDDTTTVLLVSPALRSLEWETLERYVDAGGHLVVAGRAEGFEERFALDFESARCTGALQVEGLALTTPDTKSSALEAIVPVRAESVLGTCGSLHFARAHMYGEGYVTLVGDAAIFDNASLALSDNATFAMALIDHPRGHMEFIGPWTGSGAVHPLESIARSSVGPWLLHLLGMLALFAWARGRRFGSPNLPSSSTRRSLVEHAQALGGHYRHQGDMGAALARYANWAVSVLSRRSGSSNRDLRALAESLAGARGRNGPSRQAKEIHQLLLRARAGAELGSDKAKLMQAYRVLRTMVDEITGRS